MTPILFTAAKVRALLAQPARACLNGLWKLVGQVIMAEGVLYVIDSAAACAAGVLDSPEGAEAVLWTVVKMLALEATGYLLWSDRVRFRQRIQANLMARGGEVSSAAGIAALMGGMSPESVKAIARKSFYGTTFKQLTLAHLADSAPDPELFKLSSKRNLGEIDWFVSHSWRDPAPQKWSQLQLKRAKFVEAHNREPVIWFDKLCIDQDNIENSLVCLPVFLSGCKKLLLLCGPTYVRSRASRSATVAQFAPHFALLRVARAARAALVHDGALCVSGDGFGHRGC